MHHSTGGSRPPRFVPGLLAGALLAALIAACSAGAPVPTVPVVPGASASPGASAAASPGAGASQDPQDAMLAYAKCMRQNGIDFPDPKPASNGAVGIVALPADFNSPKYQTADKACQSLLPNGGVVDPAANQKFQDQMLAYAKCMRGQGIDFPDPQVSTGGSMNATELKVDPNSPAFKAADKVCGVNMPSGGGTTITVGGTGGGAPVALP